MDATPAPLRVLPPAGDGLPLHDTVASRQVERLAAAVLPPHTLMQSAGTAVARLALAIAPHARSVWVAAGPGNNGGDGFVAATWLQAAGRRVSVSWAGSPDRLPDDARWAWERARDAGVAIGPMQPPPACDLAIDALLGLGTRRPPEGDVAEGVRLLAATRVPVLAVDLPSGLDSDTGQPPGDLVVRAAHTLSLLTLKPGLFTGSGRDLAGEVWFDALGVTPDVPATARLAGAALSRWLPARLHRQHKGSFGDVIVVAGAPGMTGAAWLCAEAALVAGAGRVYVDPLSEHAVAAPQPELMVRPGHGQDPKALDAATVACGCGGGTAVAGRLPLLLERAARLVLDADALNAVAADRDLQQALAQRALRGRPTLLTPHPLEAARLLGVSAAEVQSGRLAAAQQLADRLAAAVLLKGSGSVCAAPGRIPVINPTGNALLASAGTGDVLAGWAAGLWSQRPQAQAHEVAQAAAWAHGLAADRAAAEGRRSPLTASALIQGLAAL